MKILIFLIVYIISIVGFIWQIRWHNSNEKSSGPACYKSQLSAVFIFTLLPIGNTLFCIVLLFIMINDIIKYKNIGNKGWMTKLFKAK